MRRAIIVVLCAALFPAARGAPFRFVDSATGFTLDPAQTKITSAQSTFLIEAAGYKSRSFANESFNDNIPRIFVLQPEQLPPEIQPENIERLYRDDATVILGFLADSSTGTPLANVQVASEPAGEPVWTDERGFFQIFVPCTRERGALRFSKPGYQTQTQTGIELSPRGDWIYRIQLQPDGSPAQRVEASVDIVEPQGISIASAGTNSPIPRVPINIRISHTNGIYYETLDNYCKHSLPKEWIAAWGNRTGGSNSLNAGAVAVRTYAVGYVNSPLAGTYDICASTSCQVYDPSSTSALTDRAVDFTSGCVMVNANNAIPRGLTEYSAENNQLNMPCGDGFTAPTGGCLADPVCSGEPENGHGRGMCQSGSVRWATGFKIPNHQFDGSTNGFARQDWVWILNHYYPNLRLIQAAPLELGDPVRVIGVSTPLNVRACPGGTITNGVNCPSVGTRPLGSLGYIIEGPAQVLGDGQGYIWWKVHWQNGLEGWSVENYLDRFVPTNTAPQLAAVADAIIHAGTTFRMTNSVIDNDFPPNALTFSLPIRPAGATINSTNGVVIWPSPVASAGTTNNFTVRVTDNGSPPMTNSVSFKVTVVPPPRLTASIPLPSTLRLAWTSAAKSRYRVDYANDLSPPSWTQLGAIVTATSPTTAVTNSTTGVQQRFYRVVVVE